MKRSVVLKHNKKDQRLKYSVFEIDVTEPAKRRTVIQFCVNLGKRPVETKCIIESVTNKPSERRSLNYKWHRRCSAERKSVEDDQRSGRPTEVMDKGTVERVRAKTDEDGRVSLPKLSQMCLKRVVPCLLSANEK